MTTTFQQAIAKEKDMRNNIIDNSSYPNVVKQKLKDLDDKLENIMRQSEKLVEVIKNKEYSDVSCQFESIMDALKKTVFVIEKWNDAFALLNMDLFSHLAPADEKVYCQYMSVITSDIHNHIAKIRTIMKLGMDMILKYVTRVKKTNDLFDIAFVGDYLIQVLEGAPVPEN